MSDGAWCGFKYFAFDGQSHIRVTARSTGRGTLAVCTGRKEAPFAAIPITASADWIEAEAAFPALQGVLPLYFSYHGEGAMDFRAFVMNG